jgi:glycosyltransferase involved in cell wall biosynthesis
MRILQVHNTYQNPGGEDVVVTSEHALLSARGHVVYQWLVHNDIIRAASGAAKVKIAFNSIWSHKSQKLAMHLIDSFRPDVAHIHNTMPLISPSVYSACHQLNVPVVQTLHNYRTVCSSSYLYRDNRVCTDCFGRRLPYPAILHGCFRGSRVQSAFCVAGLSYNMLRGTYLDDVDLYIALTDFARDKLIAGGLPARKIIVKPNFIPVDVRQGGHDGGYAFFAGRLVPNKGVATLIKAWKLLDQAIPLKVAGRGPLENLLQDVPNHIEWLGQVTRDEVLDHMRDANFVIFPSEWYEPFGLAVIEAFATGAPVIASKIGAQADIVEDGECGWHFTPGAADELAEKVQQAWSDREETRRRGGVARLRFEERYGPDENYRMLMEAYRTAQIRFEQQKRRRALRRAAKDRSTSEGVDQ